MSDIPVEKKLELINQIRSQYNRNQNDMWNREQLLYGRHQGMESAFYTEACRPGQEKGRPRVSSFKMRMLLALLLLAGIIGLHRGGVELAGVAMEEVFQVISEDYYQEAVQLVEQMADTAG